jgi:indolepyruvate ferredoxin oxidoreductase alpha subunit
VRSQALSALYRAVRRGDLDSATARERLLRINSLKVRFLGDKVLQQTAWRVADELGWDDTADAEYVALTRLQADAFVTADRRLRRQLRGVVDVLPPAALRGRAAASR